MIRPSVRRSIIFEGGGSSSSVAGGGRQPAAKRRTWAEEAGLLLRVKRERDRDRERQKRRRKRKGRGRRRRRRRRRRAECDQYLQVAHHRNRPDKYCGPPKASTIFTHSLCWAFLASCRVRTTSFPHPPPPLSPLSPVSPVSPVSVLSPSPVPPFPFPIEILRWESRGDSRSVGEPGI